MKKFLLKILCLLSFAALASSAAGCADSSIPLDDITNEYPILVTIDYNGATEANGSVNKLLYCKENSYLVEPGTVTDNTQYSVPSRVGYYIEGYYFGTKDEEGNVTLGEKWDFSTDRVTQDITLYLKSAYRSYQTQATMYYNRLESNNGKDDGWVTPAGASDHQTGLGCDVVPRGWRDRAMNEDMAEEVECQWMAEHCAEFGFILRYPADKEDITEINYEPWHLRYVGKEVAAYIMDNGLCLEEFHQQLQAAIDEFLAAGGKASLVEDLIQVSAENE